MGAEPYLFNNLFFFFLFLLLLLSPDKTGRGVQFLAVPFARHLTRPFKDGTK